MFVLLINVRPSQFRGRLSAEKNKLSWRNTLSLSGYHNVSSRETVYVPASAWWRLAGTAIGVREMHIPCEKCARFGRSEYILVNG